MFQGPPKTSQEPVVPGRWTKSSSPTGLSPQRNIPQVSTTQVHYPTPKLEPYSIPVLPQPNNTSATMSIWETPWSKDGHPTGNQSKLQAHQEPCPTPANNSQEHQQVR